jgi:leucyl-tRNA synthetase
MSNEKEVMSDEKEVMSNEKEVMSDEKEVMSNERLPPLLITHYPLTHYSLPITHSPITVFHHPPRHLVGLTFVALSPEHPLAETIARAGSSATPCAPTSPPPGCALRMIATPASRMASHRRLRGDSPRAPVPIYVADYVLAEYGAAR